MKILVSVLIFATLAASIAKVHHPLPLKIPRSLEDWDFDDEDDAKPIVKIGHGEVRGNWEHAASGRKYASFEGIPYASPPVGENRFEAPKPLSPWEGVWNATEPPSNCLQWDPFSTLVTGNEDCLFVNVYSPKLSSIASLPVVVFIHGGAFLYGAGDVYGTTHLMERDMVAVTFNYRVGALGFLSTGDEVVPGNIGLKDQSFALRWVQENIRRFGGNPDSVTLMGHSSGGAAVHYHYLSPLSRGLFKRGISFCGAAFSPWAIATKPAEKAKKLAAILDCPTDDNNKMVACLKKIDGEDFVEATTKLFYWKVNAFTAFRPTVETPGTEGAFITEDPLKATASGAMYDAPLIVSTASDDGLYPAAFYLRPPSLLPEIEERWTDLAPEIFLYEDTLPNGLRTSVAARIKEHYLGGEPVGNDTFGQLVQAMGDRNFVSDVGKLAQLQASRASSPVYMFRYTFRGEKSFSYLMSWNDDDFGVAHGDEIFHIFKVPFMSSRQPEDLKMTEALIDMIYSFSTSGVPKLSQEGPEWRPVTPNTEELNYLEISSPTKHEMKSRTDFGQKSFWDSLGFIQ